MSIKISSTFDAGNIEVVNAENPADVQLKIRKDTNSDFLQWFYFRLQDVKDQSLKLNLLNAGDAAYTDGWDNYQARASYDRETWFQIPTTYDGSTLSLELTAEHDSVYIAYFSPFSYEQHLDLVNSAQLSPKCTLECIGHTTQGRPIDFLRIGDGDKSKKKLWVIARQHPGETMAEWFMLGLIDRLLDEEDASSLSLLKKANLYLVPNMNIDGSILGNLRVNANGINYNREWAEPSIENSPEVYYTKEKMRETGVDFVLDVHGDEGLPYCFLSGIEGIPSFNEKLSRLTDSFITNWMAFNPDMQNDHGYPQNESGKANLQIGSKNLGEEFHCLSQTLEMPFKQNDNIPDTELGWSSERSIKLGESLVPTMLSIVEDL
ncbi:M14 family metallopeptidase [Carboxylicivirga marina]|uniref:M14 family metallopeptidase n=1 Tax=Carboxylicivirga marina TaxID=2800988 RepID=UPI0025968A81|nr:M14-type cytosolic carboxypeptidase [uncultured Carboxylicivirga sp.]